MKKELKSVLSIFLCLAVCLCFASCRASEEEVSLWDNATYSQDQTFGEGEKTIVLEVKAEDKSVSFTVNTDKEILAEALVENELIDGEEGPYGIYVTEVNGIKADYDENKSFWSLEKDGVQLTTGVSETGIKSGDHFELVYVII